MKSDDIKPVSKFSAHFARHLRALAGENGIKQIPLAQSMNRTQAYVSERLRGQRPVDTDLIDAIGAMCKPPLAARDVIAEVLRRMRASDELATRRARKAKPERTYPTTAKKASRKPRLPRADG